MNPQELIDIIKNEPNQLQLLLEALNLLKKSKSFEQDLLTPGFLKEWLTSEILGHECHKTKHGPDAYSLDRSEKYEYLSCKEGGSFQFDRIHEDNLHRIERNNSFFFALFDKEDGLKCVKIWQCDTDKVLKEAKVKISRMSESSKHIGFGVKWVEENSQLVYSV